MAGWRVGMLSGKAAVLKEVLKVKSNMDSGMFYGLQQGAIAALEMSPDWFAKLNETYRRRRSRMEDLATKLNVMIEPEGVGLFLWEKLPEKHSD